MFSKACQYAIRATLFIAQRSLEGDRVRLKTIAKAIDSPEAFTAKILQQLARNKIIHSIKGPSGGFEIADHDLDTIRLIKIVEAIDGDQVFDGCGLGLKQCNAVKPCPVHNKFKIIREELKNMLKTTNIRELATNLSVGSTVLRV
jgi:Rrf2 family protein